MNAPRDPHDPSGPRFDIDDVHTVDDKREPRFPGNPSHDTRPQVFGAKVENAIGGQPVASDSSELATYEFIDWDSGGFFDPAHPTRLTVPAGLTGRYRIDVAIRWMHQGSTQTGYTPPADGYFWASITRDGEPAAFSEDARATASMVLGASSTSQHFGCETLLNAGQFVELTLWHRYGTVNGQTPKAKVFFQLRCVGVQ